MTRFTFVTLCFVVAAIHSFAQSQKVNIVTSDLENYWKAYDQVIIETDSVKRIQLIHELYIDKASPGLISLMVARRYQDFELVDNMIAYPAYWNSIRGNMVYLLKDTAQMRTYLDKLREVYPVLKPADIYFGVGAFRSGGTYDDDKVLFGAEFLLAQKDSQLDELPERSQKIIREFAPYDIPLNAVHEFIHTQQNEWENGSIIHLCVGEGVAEFISTLITQKPVSPPVKFGKENAERVLNQYMYEILRNDDVWNWLWSENENDLGVNDLGYYIGYEICERYYNQAADKKQAIKDLIELDYKNDVGFAKLVDGTGFFPMTIAEIDAAYEALRPQVVQIVELENGSKNISPQLNTITVEFSVEMNDCCRSVDFDETEGVTPLKIKSHLGWSEDKRHYSFEVEKLEPNTTYGLVISNFAKADGGNRLAPYTIRFTTAD